MADRTRESWMWDRACEILESAERLQRRFFRLGASGGGSPSWEPPVDVFETATELWVLVALPGVAPESVEVAVDENGLTVRGLRRLPAFPGSTIHRLEIPHGRFERRVPLPRRPLELDRTEIAQGCLVLTLRKPTRHRGEPASSRG